MEFRQLEYFAQIVEQGSFTAAAGKCAVSQPSLSAQIQKLEEELGEPLLLRKPRGVALTSSGQRVYEQAKMLLAGRDGLVEGFREREEARIGEVTVGVIPTIAPFLLGQLWERLQEEFPNVEIYLREAQTSALVEMVVSEEVDFAVMSDLSKGVLKRRSLHLQTLFREPLLLAVPSSHSLAAQRQLSVDLKTVPEGELLFLAEGHCFREQALELCQLEGVKQQVRCEQLVTLQALVAAGMGVAFVPQMFREYHSVGEVAYLKVKNPTPTRAINLLKRRGKKLKPSAEGLLKEVLNLDFEKFKS